MKDAKLLNNADAAEILGVSADMLRLSRHTGELFKGVPGPKFHKLGGAVRYPTQNLQDWLLDQRQFQSTAEVNLSQRISS